MKITILKISIMFLFLSIMGAGCEKEEEYEDISLSSLKCPCEHDLSFIKKVSVENILLFDVNETTWDEMKTQTFNGEKSAFIAYTKETKSMIFYSIRTTMTGISYVCNVPEKINGWTIPAPGVEISFCADEFELCTPHGGIANNTYSNCILTSLKRKIK